jgi:hypothetical protein
MARAKAASKANAPIPPPVAKGGNQWLPELLRMPEELVTGTVDSEAALADGTFSDKVRPDACTHGARSGCRQSPHACTTLSHTCAQAVLHCARHDLSTPVTCAPAVLCHVCSVCVPTVHSRGTRLALA